MFKKIIVPLDGSMLAEKALPYAVRLATRLDAQLFLVRSVEVPLLVTNAHRAEQELTQEAEDYLNRVTRWISSRTLKPNMEAARIHTSVFKGDPAKEICFFVNNLEIDLVIMTTHGRGGFSRLVTGSVAGKILHQLTAPVMLIRPFGQKSSQLLAETFSGVGEPYGNRFEAEDSRVLLTLDGSALSEAAIKPACELALKLKAELHLLKINYEEAPVMYGDMIGMGYINARIYQDDPENEMVATAYLLKIARKLAEKNLKPVITVKTGNNIAEQIVKYACEIQADTIVMATHAPSELGWFLTGSMAEQVMRLSHLPVLMLPVHGLVPSHSEGNKEAEENLTPVG